MTESPQYPPSRLPRVLLADDQPAYLAEMMELLRGAGYHCDCVASGQACHQELLRGQVDVLVADIRMPGNMNLELIQQVNMLPSPPAVILMTGFPTLESAIHSVKLKISAYLVKPFGFNELLSEVQQALAERHAAGAVRHQPLYAPAAASAPEQPHLEAPQLLSPSAQARRSEDLGARHPEVQRLTKREFEVLVRVLVGDDVPAIGASLFISPHTVRNHLKAIYRKLDVRSRVELVVKLGPLKRPGETVEAGTHLPPPAQPSPTQHAGSQPPTRQPSLGHSPIHHGPLNHPPMDHAPLAQPALTQHLQHGQPAPQRSVSSPPPHSQQPSTSSAPPVNPGVHHHPMTPPGVLS